MAEQDAPSEEPQQADPNAVLDMQSRLIAELRETVERQAALIDELQEDLRAGHSRKPKGRTRHTGATYEGLGVRTEAILRLAQAEAAQLREQARRDAAAHLAEAEREAAQLREQARRDAAAHLAEAECEAARIRAQATESGEFEA